MLPKRCRAAQRGVRVLVEERFRPELAEARAAELQLHILQIRKKPMFILICVSNFWLIVDKL